MPFVIPPGVELAPGDVFQNVIFPNLRAPFKRYSWSPKNQERPLVLRNDDNERHDDVISAPYQRRALMLLSHGCEIDKVIKLGADRDRRHWSCAPVEPMGEPKSQRDHDRQERIRGGTQWNRLYIPPNPVLGEELVVDLRRITAIPARLLIDAFKIASLGDEGQDELYSQISVFFTGLAIFKGPVPCQACGELIDPRDFAVPSHDDEDADYE